MGPIPVPSPRGYRAATLHLTLDPAEHARRQQTGLGHISDSPQPWRPIRHTPAAWRFAELAYASYLTQSPTSETSNAPDRAGEEARG